MAVVFIAFKNNKKPERNPELYNVSTPPYLSTASLIESVHGFSQPYPLSTNPTAERTGYGWFCKVWILCVSIPR
jgi:hypothetical protein